MYSGAPLFRGEVEAIAVLTPVKTGKLEVPTGCIDDPQARHLLEKLLQRSADDRLDGSRILKHGYLAGGLDTVQMESTFGPMQQGQMFVRSLLQQLGGSVGS